MSAVYLRYKIQKIPDREVKLRSGEEILDTFSRGKFGTLLQLATWTFEELEELKKRYKADYDASLTYWTEPGYSAYIRHRIDLLKEAITIKIGNEEEVWDCLT